MSKNVFFPHLKFIYNCNWYRILDLKFLYSLLIPYIVERHWCQLGGYFFLSNHFFPSLWKFLGLFSSCLVFWNFTKIYIVHFFHLACGRVCQLWGWYFFQFQESFFIYFLLLFLWLFQLLFCLYCLLLNHLLHQYWIFQVYALYQNFSNFNAYKSPGDLI